MIHIALIKFEITKSAIENQQRELDGVFAATVFSHLKTTDIFLVKKPKFFELKSDVVRLMLTAFYS